MNTLFHLAVSPWSERARWALDACGIEHERVVHVPFVGELLLRQRARTKKASVPLLITDDGPVQGSWAIARWADEHGRPGLFPDGKRDEIERWNDVAERALNIARARMFPRLERSRLALLESAPKALRFLGAVTVATARQGVRFVSKKYRATVGDISDAALLEVFLEWRAALGGRPTLYDRFSYADLTMATALQGIQPVADKWLPLSEATREVWTEPSLIDELPDLLAWRDALYDAHRAKA